MSNEPISTEIEKAYRYIFDTLKASKMFYITDPDLYEEAWLFQRIPPLELFPGMPTPPVLLQTRGIPMSTKEAKARLLDFIRTEIEVFCECRDDIQNIIGYYDNFEEGMTYQLMSPQEYLQYTFEEILRMRNSRKVLY